MIDADSTLEDVAFAACTALDRAGISAVLTGGSAAVFYAPQTMQSHDADFVLQFGAQGGEIRALASIGFERQNEGFFAHPHSSFTIEFPPGPLSIGSDVLTSFATERRGDEVLHVLNPTDCVRDRFIIFFAWGDITGLNAAVSVASAIGVRFDAVAFSSWAERESKHDSTYVFERVRLFFDRLDSSRA